MFQALQNFFSWIQEISDGLLGFVQGLVSGLSMMLKAFPKIITISSQAIGFVPSIFTIFISLTVIVSIVYMILGREAGDG